MRHYHSISVISVLAAIPLVSLQVAKPLSPHWDDIHIKHTWDAVPENWESLGHPSSDTTIDLYLALKPHRENALIDALYEVSSPKHPKYGHYLSKEQVAELVAPHPDTLDLVNSWLDHHGIPPSSVSTTHGGNTLMLKDVSVTQANTLLDASYQLYRYVGSSETIVRTVGYALPMVLHEHVLTVVPTTTFFPPRTQWRNHSGEAATGPIKSSAGERVTMVSSRQPQRPTKYDLRPAFLLWLYQMAEYVPLATNRNRLGIAGYLNDYPSPADLWGFLKVFRSGALDATYKVVLVNGGEYNPAKPTEEGDLDVQTATALVYPTPITFYSTGEVTGTSEGTSTVIKDDRMTVWLKFMIDQEEVPQTITTSYSQDEDYGSQAYSNYVCLLLAQLGGRGVSLLFSTGDDGVGKGNCKLRDGSVQFIVAFPATCPYVTAVGGTTRFDPEEGAGLSGGGFSEYFPRPPYQDDLVPTFLQNLGDQYQGMFNPEGRGIPDISAQALWFPIILNGRLKWVNGTSGSVPVVASVITLLNDYQLSKGRKPLGFLNPWLYKFGFETLFDIIGGSNPGCGTDGFPAIQGWDPITGLGTPDFGDMQDLLDVMAARGQVP